MIGIERTIRVFGLGIFWAMKSGRRLNMHTVIFPRIVGVSVALLVLAMTYTPAVADFNA